MENSDLKKLFSPTKLGTLSLNNRMVMAPLTRSRAGNGDMPNAFITAYYRQRATVGLIITETLQISTQGKSYPRTPGIFTEQQIHGWKAVTEAVHSEGGRIFLKIGHVGRLSHSIVQPGGTLPIAPSAIKPYGMVSTYAGPKPFETPRALAAEEIPGIVADFKQAANNARQAGFDGVEIHAANGYLIDQFLRDRTNIRTDDYGGPIENRARFLKEVVEAVIPVFGVDRVGVSLSPIFNGFSMSDSDSTTTFGYVVQMLSHYGLAYLHAIQLGTGSFDFVELKRKFGGTYIANGGYSITKAESAIDAGEADLVAFGSMLAILS